MAHCLKRIIYHLVNRHQGHGESVFTKMKESTPKGSVSWRIALG